MEQHGCSVRWCARPPTTQSMSPVPHPSSNAVSTTPAFVEGLWTGTGCMHTAAPAHTHSSACRMCHTEAYYSIDAGMLDRHLQQQRRLFFMDWCVAYSCCICLESCLHRTWWVQCAVACQAAYYSIDVAHPPPQQQCHVHHPTPCQSTPQRRGMNTQCDTSPHLLLSMPHVAHRSLLLKRRAPAGPRTHSTSGTYPHLLVHVMMSVWLCCIPLPQHGRDCSAWRWVNPPTSLSQQACLTAPYSSSAVGFP
jgi:hypothetical protein